EWCTGDISSEYERMRILPTTDPLRWPSNLSDGGAKTRLNVSTLCFLSHPGAISPMG
ncbi:unnamed protein product, partial [Pylaiella littoralis]